MQELLLTDVDDGVLEDLRQRATRHGRTPAEEATEILAEALRSKRHDVWEPVGRKQRKKTKVSGTVVVPGQV